jgi:hypothetical protein
VCVARMPGQPVTIRTRGLTSVDLKIQMIVLFGSALVLVDQLLLNWGKGADWLLVAVGITAAVAVVAEIALMGILSIRSVSVDDSGVTFRYPFYRRHGGWMDLTPSSKPISRGLWAIFRRDSAGVERGHWVTLEQARAILGHPSCPRWPLPAEVRQSLGLTAN